MRVKGDIDLEGNSLKRVNIETVVNYPQNPTPGRIIFKEGRVMVCVELNGGIPVWVPLTNELDAYIHDQTELSSVWTINHNFNTALLSVQVVDENNLTIIPSEIDMSVFNVVTIQFGMAFRGKAILQLGATVGTPKASFAFSQSFTNTDTIVVNHGLGYEPITRIFIGNQEVQPETLTHNSTTQLTVTFSTQQSGTVRCI